ncbi:MAG TPA: fused MFS/spermidine synthase [Terriglobales bacterium]|nr:fused MFS/spermidine synthase [Terriglobales bacterium]
MNSFFVLFFVSGFCSILYEIVWLRLAMAQFGVTSALVSIVLSMFMAGLGLGSWGSGYLIRRFEHLIRFPPLRLYAVAELLIGVSAVLVPLELAWGRTYLVRLSLSSSGAWYLASGGWIALTLIPWCACMGATIPLAMLAIRNNYPQEEKRAFSFLYLANVLGAVAGAIVPLLLIEVYGFHGTLKIGALLNALLALSAAAVSLQSRASAALMETSSSPAPPKQLADSRRPLVLLFATGCTSMGMEVVWIRQLTPYLGTVVYAFAAILAWYLLSNFVGSRIYRIWSRSHPYTRDTASALVGLFVLFPLVSANPQFQLSALMRLALGIVPFSVTMGFLTPMLVDRWSGGDPEKAGSAYAVNVVGCILGPLIAGFLFLPLMSERWVLFLFALPWLVLGSSPARPGGDRVQQKVAWQRMGSYAVALLALLLVFVSRGYEDQFAGREVLRDNTATVVATGEGMEKRLFVNGVGMTTLTPIAKMMAHLPLAFLDHAPRNALAVCFGMGTTYRSLLSWNIPTTVVELVPSVPRMFWYYHSDGPQLLHSPLSHVMIDDGRRYLERITEQYEVITIDPPPPIEAAGSSLLYSEEFLLTVKQRLRPGGILQLWLPPGGDPIVEASIARAVTESFPHVRVFHGFWGWGYHFIASNDPILNRTAAQLAQRMPDKAAEDLTEWGPQPTAEGEFASILNHELSLDQMIAEAPSASALHDDWPANEYYVLRRQLSPGWGQYLLSQQHRGPMGAGR